MSDNLGEMGVFVQVVDGGSFSAAARALRVTPSAVSKQIARLEGRLGVRLLQRSTRQIAVTEEGRAYYQNAARILADVAETEQALASAKGEPVGTLRISTSIAFGRRQIAPILPEFMTRYPKLRIDLSCSDAIVDLVEENIDVAIRIAHLTDSSLVARKLADNRRIVCAAPDYIARRGKPERPEDLKQHNCLTLSYASSLNIWEFEEPDGLKRIEVSGNIESDVTEMVYDLGIAGMGILRSSEFVVGADIRAGRLVPLLTEYRQPESPPMWAVYPHRRHLSARVRAFVDFLVEKFTPEPPWRCWSP
ncbi:MAG TPA: LysR family transcriptional regulator [Alphaproteobacteria bacterium]|nr:LysR family transcriptional regulator [Alphaproteobacteria bacterium]